VPVALVAAAGQQTGLDGGGGRFTCFLRDGDRTFLTYNTTGRGNEDDYSVTVPG
jgi:hypothetical protein